MNKPTTAEYFLTLRPDGTLQGWSQVYPPLELKENQIPITRMEFYFLKDIDGKLDDALRIIKQIQRKIKRNAQ